MCKIMAFSDMTKLNVRQAAERIGRAMLQIERDGYGYAVQGANGVFGEKCAAPKFASRFGTAGAVALPIVKRTCETFGDFEAKAAGPGIFHGRTSTNVKGLLNCHPMQREAWHLIHNGVVTDEGQPYAKFTDNDSEDVLHRLMQGIASVERNLTGYYAFAAIDPTGRLHVCRDSLATLYVAWSPSHSTYVFCTKDTLLRKLCKALRMKIGPVDELTEDQYMIFQGNELIHRQDIKPRGWGAREAVHAGASLGRTVDTVGTGFVQDTTQDYASAYADRSERLEREEQEYYDRRREVEAMDASYRVWDQDGSLITVTAFRRMDHIAQDLCTIERPDGSIVDPLEASYAI